MLGNQQHRFVVQIEQWFSSCELQPLWGQNRPFTRVAEDYWKTQIFTFSLRSLLEKEWELILRTRLCLQTLLLHLFACLVCFYCFGLPHSQ